MVLSSLASVSSGSLPPPPPPTDIVRTGLAVYFDAADPACYNSEVPTTTLNDLSGNGRNGTLARTGTSGNYPTVVDGLVNIQSDSTANANFVSTTYAPVIEVPGTEYTFEIWFRDNDGFRILFNTPGTDGTASTALVSNFPAGATQGALLHIVGPSNTNTVTDAIETGSLLMAERTSNVDPNPNDFPKLTQRGVAGAFSRNRWYHVVMTATIAAQIHLYINGQPYDFGVEGFPRADANLNLKASTDTPNSIRFGGGFQHRGQTCLLGPMRVYMDKALSADEVLNNYEFEKNRFPDNV